MAKELTNEIYGLTVSGAARSLGVSTRTVLDWTAKGALHPRRAASGWRYFDPKEITKLARKRARRCA